MSETTSPIVFLDANVLAKPVTRTLLMFARNQSDYHIAWSQYVETEADRNLRPLQRATQEVREIAGLDLTPPGVKAEQYSRTEPSDRQVLADAVAADASFIVTEDVDDFGVADLTATGIAAVNPDLFLAERTTRDGYAEAVTLISESMTNPPRTPEELHAMLGRQHPLTLAAYRTVFGADRCLPLMNLLPSSTGATDVSTAFGAADPPWRWASATIAGTAG